MTINKQRLTIHIIIGLVLGAVAGVVINETGNTGWVKTWVVDGAFDVVGRVFIRLLLVLVVPLVFVSLVCGAASLDDVRKLGRVGAKTLGLYLVTTALAISLAIVAAAIFEPGRGVNAQPDASYSVRDIPPLKETLINIVPSNLVDAMAKGEMLPVVIAAVLFGLALVVSGDPGRRMAAFFADANEVIMKLVFMVMLAAPYGVFCLVGRTFANEGFAAIWALGKYFFLVIAVLLVHGVLVYSGILALLARVSPLQFFRNARAAHLFAFSTASSNATLPVTLDVAKSRMGIRNSIASFVLPLGATINMDGTAIMQGVATVFIAQFYNLPLGLSDYLVVILIATLASIGTAGVPSAGILMLTMVLKQVGLPVEGITMILGVDRLLDMIRTAVNVTGDLMVGTVVARSEGQLDDTVFAAENPPVDA